MSKERDLLNKAIEMIQIVPMMASIGKVPPNFGAELILEIQELLAQPEDEADRGSDPISKLRNLRDIQGREGNYDMDEYMRGLYNGLELSLSIFEDRSPDYKEPIAKPEHKHMQKWLNLGYAQGMVDAEKAHGIGGE